jgi:hypothetical protein
LPSRFLRAVDAQHAAAAAAAAVKTAVDWFRLHGGGPATGVARFLRNFTQEIDDDDKDKDTDNKKRKRSGSGPTPPLPAVVEEPSEQFMNTFVSRHTTTMMMMTKGAQHS